ncbi:MAG: hypothetical protein V2A58_09635 [Planctomycetota bacterium]
MRISNVPYQSHAVITHEELLGSSLILRMPEFVKSPRGEVKAPGNIVWEVVEREGALRYRWEESEEVKAAFTIDFAGEARAGEDAVDFEVTMTSVGGTPAGAGVYLFCLQAGAYYAFHDYEGVRTYVRLQGRWASVHEMEGGRYETHRMCGYPVGREGVAHNLMAKVSADGEWVLGMALDQAGHVSCNLQLWPSCIHANPKWRELAAGEREVARGKVYLFRGDLEALYARYLADFGTA